MIPLVRWFRRRWRHEKEPDLQATADEDALWHPVAQRLDRRLLVYATTSASTGLILGTSIAALYNPARGIIFWKVPLLLVVFLVLIVLAALAVMEIHTKVERQNFIRSHRLRAEMRRLARESDEGERPSVQENVPPEK